MEPSESIRTYVIVYFALLALLALTIAAAYVNLGPFNIVVALTIAAAKAFLIFLFYMHLRRSSLLTRLVAVAGILWLAILFALMLSDYLTRFWVPALG